MGQTVIKVDQDTIFKMKKHYHSSISSKQPPHATFVAKKNGLTITAYTSGKVMFQGDQHEEEASLWGSGVKSNNKKKSSGEPELPKFLSQDHIGSDEAGTGDYFGPITVGAVFATAQQQELLRELGVQDSKNMKDDTIKKIVKDILKTDIVYSTVTLSNEKYNSLKQKNWSQVRMKAWMHHQAIKHVIGKLDGQESKGILVDKFCEPGIFYNKIRASNEQPLEGMTFLTKGESKSTCVAAASMLARYRFVQEMDKLSGMVGFNLQKGASNIVDKQIKRIINSKGEPFLDKIAKVHFANTDKAKKL
ncbi:ribonuclease HIII [Halalkalibacillus sediminis]|uniref:Ribonuclease HIII n=2 Tax=Halalkalibacillus sediminis TaxID=2018042 RepID=A0A2I0QY31_9BACI|nr:ribonuclease HIII [Halalkalibacillus sediminis]